MKLFLDMDGTIAKFNSKRNALQRFDNEIGFFATLKPYVNIHIIDNMISNSDINIYVISASPNVIADNDKMAWLNQYLPSLPQENICFCRLGENKAIAIEKQLGIKIDSSCYLLDDYTKNLIEWKNNGGIGIKRLTSLADNSTKKWLGFSIRNLKELEKFI